MKISCPGCGRTYAIPPDLIDRILKEHAAKPHEPQSGSLLEVQPARRSKVKLAMLVITILWPIGIAWMTYTSYHETMLGYVPNGIEGQVFSPALGVTRNEDSIAGASFFAALTTCTILWAVSMAFLATVRFTTRR